MDVADGFLLADSSHAKALTGIDDHSRSCVSAQLMARERTRPVCEVLAAALAGAAGRGTSTRTARGTGTSRLRRDIGS
jgi:hypothetical protein